MKNESRGGTIIGGLGKQDILYEKLQTSKQNLRGMVGRGPSRSRLIRKREVSHATPFGAYANKFIEENSEGRVKSYGDSLSNAEIKDLKCEWFDVIEHCIEQLDVRFPPENLELFQLLQVVNPSYLVGMVPREKIGELTTEGCVKELLHIFELPLHGVEQIQKEEVLNGLISFKGNLLC